MFTQDRRLVALACPCHVKLSSEPVLLSICRNSKKPFSICQVVLVLFCRYLITYSIPSLTLSRCLSEWDNKANWIDSREMWNFNTNRAEQSAVTGDQRDKLNIYISRCPRVQPCVLFRLRELFHFTNCWFVRSDRRQVSPESPRVDSRCHIGTPGILTLRSRHMFFK